MTTTTAPTTTCPDWCITDHAADDARERARAAQLGREPHASDLAPFHASEQTIVGDPSAGQHEWGNVSLSIDLDTGRPMVSILDIDVTVDVAEELVRVLPGIIAQAQGATL